MFKALLLCVCQLGDRTGSSACRKWKICHIVSKLCSGCAPLLLLLPSPLRSSRVCWLLPESVTTKRWWAGKHKNNVCDFTRRPISSADSWGYDFQSISLEKQHEKGGDNEKEQKHFPSITGIPAKKEFPHKKRDIFKDIFTYRLEEGQLLWFITLLKVLLLTLSH